MDDLGQRTHSILTQAEETIDGFVAEMLKMFPKESTAERQARILAALQRVDISHGWAKVWLAVALERLLTQQFEQA